MNERVLITGASGFIGYHLIQSAQAAGLEVHAAVRPSSEVGHLRELGATFVYPDFSSEAALADLLEKGKYAYIIHAAGATRAKDLETYNLVNAEYTRNLAKAALSVSTPLKRFVFVSSLAAIGPKPYADQPITEATPPKPITSYGKSKLLAEQYLKAIKNLPLTIIRPTAVYGPREKDLFILFKTLTRGLDLYIGRQPQKLSFVYVEDLVSAIINATLKEQKNGVCYHITDGRVYDRYALAGIFGELTRKKALRFHVPVSIIKLVSHFLESTQAFSKKPPVLNAEKIKELTAENWDCDVEAARVQLQYLPQYDLKSGLTETLKWYKAHKWL